MNDPYQTLGVSKNASASEIKSAYRKLAKKFHPDVNPGRKDIEQKFKEVSAAYDLLSDQNKRAQFDRGDIDAQGQPRGFGGNPYGGFSGAKSGFRSTGADPFSAFGGMEDIFAEFMGMGSRQRRSPHSSGNTGSADTGGLRGSDVTYKTTISFVESCLGGTKRITLTNDKTVDITLPPGAEEGHKLRLKGQGLPGLGGIPGDAFVEIHVESHPFFTRKDHDIYLETPVSLPEAVLGAQITVPTLNGKVAVKIPKGSNSGTSLRLKGKGISGSPPGDMFVKLKIVLPEPLPQDFSDFIEKWSKKNSYDPRKKMGFEN